MEMEGYVYMGKNRDVQGTKWDMSLNVTKWEADKKGQMY